MTTELGRLRHEGLFVSVESYILRIREGGETVMSLDPRAHERRGRSKSPGRERERSRSRIEEVETVRERSRVRVPSPPTSRYDDVPRGGAYAYEETTTRKSSRPEKVQVITAEPRGSYGTLSQYRDERDDSPPARGGRGGGSTAVAGVASYAMPGAFGAEEEDVDRRYTASKGRGGTTKDYYDEKRTTTTTAYGGGRGEREKDYYDEKRSSTTYGGGDRGEREKDYYDEKRSSTTYGGGGIGERERDYYAETKTVDRGYPGRGGGSKDYGHPIDLHERDAHRYEDADKYKYGDPRHSKDEVDKYKYSDPRHSKDDGLLYGDEPGPAPGRERGASFNVTAGHHSISGNVNVGHGPQGQNLPYVPQPAPSDFQYPGAPPPGRQYAEPPKWEYAKPVEKISYSKVQETTYGKRPASPPSQYTTSRHGSRQYESAAGSAHSSQPNILSVEPGSRLRQPSPGPAGLAPRMHSLSVSTGHHGGASMSLATAPGSPLLEAYHGTYQSISPMPSPLMIANTPHHSDIAFIEPLSPESSDDDRRGERKSKRTARFHDPIDEATILAKALKGEKRAPDTQPLIEILPGLTHEQILELRVEYKRIVKTGSEKKGVNIAKHIKLRLKEEDPSLMKACYACALGKWESEAYWANFWYQGEKSRRELLIESLMGRTNAEIRAIKDGFSDKKYSDSLVKCMKTELKEDKFKRAVLLVLEEKKMEERHGYGLDMRLVEDDVHDLHKAVRSEKGGETAIISIVVVRSDAHLREVLRLYESTYRANFAREMLKKSGNLVVSSLSYF